MAEPRLHVVSFTLSLPCSGTVSDDVHHPSGLRELHTPHFSAAVADGLARSTASGVWAQELVEASVRGAFNGRDHRATSLGRRWKGEVARQTTAWYGRLAAARGAHATLLGVTLRASALAKDGIGFYTAHAVGDCCLFVVECGRLMRSWPYTAPEQLRTSTEAISVESKSMRSASRRNTSGPLRCGTALWLATDGMAQYLLRCVDAGTQPWAELQDLERRGHGRCFESWARSRQRSGVLAHDDLTLLRIHVYG